MMRYGVLILGDEVIIPVEALDGEVQLFYLCFAFVDNWQAPLSGLTT